MIITLNQKTKFFFIIFVVFSILFIFTPRTEASTEIYFQKEAIDIKEGDIFSVELRISSTEKIINVIDGTVIYDKDRLKIEKISKDNSVVSLWVMDPSFNNETGELSFIGGIPSGFQGEDAQILEVTFLAKKVGLSTIGFKDVFSVFLNDGKGTKISPWLKPLSISIDKEVEVSSNDFGQKQSKLIFTLLGLMVLFIFTVIIKRYKKNAR